MMIKTRLLTSIVSFVLVLFSLPALAQGKGPGSDEQIKLYPGKAPGEPTLKDGEKVKEMSYRRGFHFDVHEPTIDVYHAKGDNRTKAAVVLCPGGGYGAVASGGIETSSKSMESR